MTFPSSNTPRTKLHRDVFATWFHPSGFSALPENRDSAGGAARISSNSPVTSSSTQAQHSASAAKSQHAKNSAGISRLFSQERLAPLAPSGTFSPDGARARLAAAPFWHRNEITSEES